MNNVKDERPQANLSGLRMLRLTQDRSLADLAAESGVTKATLSKWERGEVDVGSRSLRRIAAAYGLDALARELERLERLQACGADELRAWLDERTAEPAA